ncbi:MAG: hypothetical protein QOG35_2764 [Solirubrobacteraceae bacterium]|nr:hypothetical protein [Solirubrobacteraceae bacterium]
MACAALLGGPAAAHAAAAAAKVDRACYAGGEQVSLSGSGFAPSAPVSITGLATAATNADVDGAFSGVLVKAPKVGSATPRTFTLNATSPTEASLSASVSFPVVRARFWSNAPISGTPSKRVTWRFAGFVPGKRIYGHLRFQGKGITTRVFGTARGPCGLLTVRSARVPIRHLRAGRWALKLDQRRAYAATTPGRVYTFRVSRGT